MVSHLYQPVPLILGSGSPRRAELLAACGFNFSVLVKPTAEEWTQNLDVQAVAGFLAQKKAEVFTEEAAHSVIITADTIVVLGEQILNKPGNAAEAETMLQALSGQTHYVYTAFSLRYKDEISTFTERVEVGFSNLTPEIINHYIFKRNYFKKSKLKIIKTILFYFFK
jgi:septum formation protein